MEQECIVLSARGRHTIEPMTTCTECGKEIDYGAWPFCPHESTRQQAAQHFDPIIVHLAPDGSYRFPAATDAKVPEGYRKIEIRSIQEADRISREVNSQEDATLRNVQRQTETGRSLTRSRNRAFMDSIRHKLSPAGREYLDRAREYVALKDRERENSKPRSVNFHMDIFSNDSSNRERYADERTAWKGRKG
jgi:hypothetical protein